MKTVKALVLSLSLASMTLTTYCWEEYGAVGVGVLTAYQGLKMMSKSLGKKGTTKQFIVGTALFSGGGYMAFAGPGKVKTWQQSNNRFSKMGQTWESMTKEARKELAVEALDEQIRRESGEWKKRFLMGLREAVQTDPTGLLAKTFPWSYVIQTR